MYPKMKWMSCISAKFAIVITMLSWPESKATKLGKFGAGRTQKDEINMEQLFIEMQLLANQALYTFSTKETLKLLGEDEEEKCDIYYF